MRHRLALLALLSAAPLHAQSAVTDSSPFRELPLPAPNAVRTDPGRPGAGYWQQRVDYRIAATLDPARNELQGRETIHYVNRSPDALPYLWMFLEQNMCEAGQRHQPAEPAAARVPGFGLRFLLQGILTAGSLSKRCEASAGSCRARSSAPPCGWICRKPLPPGAVIDLEIAWRFPVPDYGGGRMGHDGTLYEFGQWYPRMAVYDDVRGWNHEPYIGGGEFYLEYGRFDVSITLPAAYVVAATGRLQNPLTVLTAAQRARLARARTSDTAIAIITADEAGDAARTRPVDQRHPDLAFQCRQRAGLRLRRGAQLPLGCERLPRDLRPHLLPA